MQPDTITLPDGQMIARNSVAMEELERQMMAHAAAHAVGCRVFCCRYLGASVNASCGRHASHHPQAVPEPHRHTVSRLGPHVASLLLVDIHQREFAAQRDMPFYPAPASWRDGAEVALWNNMVEDDQEAAPSVLAAVRRSYDAVLRHEIDAIFRHMQVFGDLTSSHVARVLNAMDERVPIEVTVNDELRRGDTMAWVENRPRMAGGRVSDALCDRRTPK
jgi:hypothetical protein